MPYLATMKPTNPRWFDNILTDASWLYFCFQEKLPIRNSSAISYQSSFCGFSSLSLKIKWSFSKGFSEGHNNLDIISSLLPSRSITCNAWTIAFLLLAWLTKIKEKNSTLYKCCPNSWPLKICSILIFIGFMVIIFISEIKIRAFNRF